MYDEKEFKKAIEQSFKMYNLKGARSTAKLLSIHKYMADVLIGIFGNDYEVFYLGDKEHGDISKEKQVMGKYYPKNIDITIVKDGEPVFCLGIKFVTSNYKQNANNYFENMIGETANIQAAKLLYAHLIILRQPTPYFKKNQKTPSKLEIINDHDIKKYSELIFETAQAHKPVALAIPIITIDNEGSIKFVKVDKDTSFSKATANILNTKLSMTNLISEINSYANHLKIK
ncbi:MAG: hypothetical protein LBL74_06030 [Bacteroidales bacterium]|jgi:hypothetical protein|nr:hypothetical protein [Bacteroidales bacterium]